MLKSDGLLEEALAMAGDNRIELEKVLRHYAGDTLKLQTAKFLIAYMPYHTYRTGEELNKAHRLYSACSHHKKAEIPGIVKAFEEKEGKIDLSSLSGINDVRSVKSELLIANIDKAFEAWRHFPWGKQVTFDVFCEYVLPYRVGDEQPVEWRTAVMEHWKTVTDSLVKAGVDNPLDAGRVIFDKLYQQHPVFSSWLPATPHLGPEVIRWNVGSCRDMCDILTYTFRALGIPCSKDFLVSGDYNTGHFWNSIPGVDKPLWIDLASGMFVPISAYKDVRAKAFREIYSQNEGYTNGMSIDKEQIAKGFRYPNFIDVTPLYADGKLIKSLTFSRKQLFKNVDADMPFYLCIPKKMDWVPVDMTSMEGGEITFHNLKAGTVFVVGQYADDCMRICSLPMRTFVRNGRMSMRPFEVGKEKKVTLYSKFVLDEEQLRKMVGGVFEGSDDIAFSQSDTLYVVKEAPERLCTEVDVVQRRAYKYVRYRSPGGKDCDISDFAFYSSEADTVSLKGKRLSGKSDRDSGCWVGLCFPKREYVRKIMYTPSNDGDSFIRKGDLYELFYWDRDAWKSKGCRTASSDVIDFWAPSGSLLYLKNLTKGRYERVFEYINGKQIWW